VGVLSNQTPDPQVVHMEREDVARKLRVLVALDLVVAGIPLRERGIPRVYRILFYNIPARSSGR
jgi:hypothetical protein